MLFVLSAAVLIAPLLMYVVWFAWAKAHGQDTMSAGRPIPWVTATETDRYGHELTDDERRRNLLTLLASIVSYAAVFPVLYLFFK